MTDDDLCRAIGEDLERHYPGHPWNVGVDLTAGHVAIELGYEHPEFPNATFGYRLHPGTLMNAGGQQRVMQAGGELLERYGLARSAADGDSAAAAAEHGMVIEDTRDGAWLAKKAAEKGV